MFPDSHTDAVRVHGALYAIEEDGTTAFGSGGLERITHNTQAMLPTCPSLTQIVQLSALFVVGWTRFFYLPFLLHSVVYLQKLVRLTAQLYNGNLRG